MTASPPRHSAQALFRSARMIALAGLLYALRALAFGWAGAVPTAPSPLPIVSWNFFFWEMIYILPLFVLGWLVVSAFAKALGRGLGGRGTFRATAAAMAPALTIPLLLVWLFEMVIAVLMLCGLGQLEFTDFISAPGFWQGVFIGYHILGALGLLALTVRALAAAQQLRRWKAALAGTLAASLFLLLLIVFVR